MGSFDCFCALCGGPTCEFDQPEDFSDYDDTDEQQEGTSRLGSVDKEKCKWLFSVRLIGENEAYEGDSKVFVSGPSSGGDLAMFEVTPGDDPRFPVDETCLMAYYTDAGHPVAFPFHEPCYELLCRKTGTTEMDHEIFYQILKQLREDRALAIPYGVIEQCQEQFWYMAQGLEPCVALPTVVPELTQYYNHLPVEEVTNAGQTAIRSQTSKAGTDPFAALPVEVVLLLVSNLDLADFMCLQAASRTVLSIGWDQKLWRTRIKDDMPWLYDLPTTSDGRRESQSIDWLQVYKDLREMSKMKSISRIDGLVNRRRIWEISEPISNPYLTEVANRRRAIENSAAKILKDARATRPTLLRIPKPPSAQLFRIALIGEEADMAVQQLTISVHFTPSGELSGFGVAPDSKRRQYHNHILGFPRYSATRQQFDVPVDDWLTGIVITSVDGQEGERKAVGATFLFAERDPVPLGQTEGNQRILFVAPDHVIVGLAGRCCPSSGVLSTLGFLQRPQDSFFSTVERAQNRRPFPCHPSAMKFLWKSALPPPSLRLLDPEYHHFSAERDQDLMEAYIFGTTEEEKNKLVEISGDMYLHKLQVLHVENEVRTISPVDIVAKSLRIRGKHGERVVAIFAYFGHLLCGLRFVTNWNRQLRVGRCYGNVEKPIFSSELGATSHSSLAGFHCCWGSGRPKTPWVFGALVQDEGNESPVIDAPRDSYGFPWEPEPPPSSWTEQGTTWGQCRPWVGQPGGRIVWKPTENALVYWLDCRRPLLDIEASFFFAPKHEDLPLAYLAFRSTSGNEYGEIEQSVGARRLDDLSNMQASDKDVWSRDRTPSRGLSKIATRWSHTRWHVGNQRLRCLRIWTIASPGEDSAPGAAPRLAGIQFVAEDGMASPKWGFYTEGDPHGVINFIAGSTSSEEGAVQGLKLVLGSLYPSLIVEPIQNVVGIQGLGISQ